VLIDAIPFNFKLYICYKDTVKPFYRLSMLTTE